MIAVLKENKAVFDATGVSRWHDAGFDGSLGLSLTFERFTIPANMKDNVSALFTDIAPLTDGDGHGYYTAMAHLQVAPGRKIVQMYEPDAPGTVGLVDGFLTDTALPLLLQVKPDTGFRSMIWPKSGYDAVYGKLMPFCTLVNSAGNSSNDAYSKLMKDEAWLGCGAVALVNGEWRVENYTSSSEYVDFCAPTGFYEPATTGVAVNNFGTSFSGPFLSGQIALINHFFLKNIGRSLSMSEMVSFLKANSIDMGITGKDVYTGNGLVILPDPSSINLKEYDTAIIVPVTQPEETEEATPTEETEVTMGIVHSYNAFINGEQKLATNFKVKEFQCKDGSGALLIADDLITLLQKIRTHFGKSVTINSAYRNPSYNDKIGGADGSQHKLGTAADIVVSGVTPRTVAKYADTLMPATGGIGLYEYSGGFTHVDVRTTKSRWLQTSKTGSAVSVSGF